MAVQANAFKGTAAASSFGKRNTPIESALGSELAANPPTIPVVDHKQDSGVEAKTISTLEGVYSKGLGVFMLDIGTGITAFVAGKVAGLFKFSKGQAFIDKWLRAPIWAMRNTEIGKINEFGMRFTESAEGLVRKAGDVAHADVLAEKLTEKQSTLAAKAKPATTKQAGRVSGWLHALDSNPIGQAIGKPLRAFSRWREGINATKSNIHINNVLGIENKGGFFGIGQKAGTGSKVGLEIKGLNHEGILGLRNAKAASQFDEHINAAAKVAREQLDIMNSKTASKEAKAAAKGVYEQASKVANSLREAKINFNGKAGYAGFNAAKGGLGKFLKALPKATGKASVFHAIIGVGVAAGVTASWLTTKRENRLGKQSLIDMAADVYDVPAEQVTKDMLQGEKAHPLIKEASKIYSKQARGRYISSAAYTAGDTVLLATLRGLGGAVANNHGLMGNQGFGPVVPVMAAQMGLPMLGEMMVPENQTLNAYAVLSKVEKEGQPIERDEKIYLVRQLMATVPAVARNHGAHNAITPAVAEEIVDRNLSTKEMVRTISEPKRFVEITREVIEKQEKQKLAEEKDEGKKAPEAEASKEKAAEASPMLQAAKPAKTTQLKDSDYQGRIGQQAQPQLA